MGKLNRDLAIDLIVQEIIHEVIQEGEDRQVKEVVENTKDVLLNNLIDGLLGSKPEFREILTDKDELLRRVCDNAEAVHEKTGLPPWCIIGEIMGHGAGVANAIYELYRRREADGPRKDVV